MNQFEENEQEFIETKEQIKRLLRNSNSRNVEQQIQSEMKQLKFSLTSMEQESISIKKHQQKVKQYQNEYLQLQQEINQKGIQLAQQALFGKQFDALRVQEKQYQQHNMSGNDDNEIYISNLRSNNTLIGAKHDIYKASQYADSMQSNVNAQNKQLDKVVQRTQHNQREFDQAEGDINTMQRRINLNKCLLYSLFAFIVAGFLFIIIYKAFL
ncbi:transmembrane protein, putative (macronuclear) [Tetrahymena thermophila SB210]|uniref:Transmembrane protein, putative n=1 Tax=Tetrahymena thermophila (strain SB210) TaxID=312017 RepID=Q230U7_TETTS|nr:transmembrane protein, putative [Tetrahymena thermophila SB210]EAR91192.2 transmembrane protein, putative [Tetrahymena thermophila SB210]|eukprot:XP_001011437.2 transmembrane protein, putative [Tetrahymena thermophila SB210]